MQNIPRRDIKIVIGDCNKKVGHEEIYKHVTGRNSKYLNRNDNGNKLIHFAIENMKIMSTYS